MFDEEQIDTGREQQIEDKFFECMVKSPAARRGLMSAKRLGMGEDLQLKAAIIQLVELSERLSDIVNAATSRCMDHADGDEHKTEGVI